MECFPIKSKVRNKVMQLLELVNKVKNGCDKNLDRNIIVSQKIGYEHGSVNQLNAAVKIAEEISVK